MGRYFAPRSKPNNPKTAATPPPISSHIDLSVGEPVNARETSELKEFDAWNPKTSIATPATSNATDRALFIVTSTFVVF
jgi:hypothetical protein